MKIVLALLLVASCKSEKKAAGPVHGSCQSSPGVCEEYEGDAKYVGRQKDGCKGATWTDAPCITVNLAGSCRETHGWTRTRHYYRGIEGQANPAADKAKAECAAYGTWVEPSH